jgi:transcriptional regulator with XRE-family HTH domain
MSREAAGAALRTLRESRDWSLADLAEASGVSVMGLSFLERGARKPHKATIHKVENALGLPPGTYVRLLEAADAQAEARRLLADSTTGPTPTPVAVTVDAGIDTSVFHEYAASQRDMLQTLIDHLPPPHDNRYENEVTKVLSHCVRNERLAVDAWRSVATTGGESAGTLLELIGSLEAMRRSLLDRLSDSVSARLDRACRAADLPESLLCALLGIESAQLWDMRNGGAIPPHVLRRVRAFIDATLPRD